jgi:hypothetical protein
MSTSADLKSLRDTLRHALECFEQAHSAPDDVSDSLATSVDYLLRAAATHEGCRLSFLAYAYWQEWHDAMEGTAGDAKEFRMGAEEMEESVSLDLCGAMPETWDSDEDGDGDE